MALEAKLDGCRWWTSLEHEIENFDANPGEYPLITRKENSELYRNCIGCDERKKVACPYYLPSPSRSH